MGIWRDRVVLFVFSALWLQVAKEHWEFWHGYLVDGCMHGPHCVRRKKEGHCNFGARAYDKYIVTGQLRSCSGIRLGGG